MLAAIATLGELAAGRRAVAVLGDMLELGAGEDEEHAALGRLLPAHRIDHLITVGERARHAASAARAAGVGHVVDTDDPAAAAATAAGWAGAGDWILVKASRGMRLERVVEALREKAT
jgi:UDP-N-acetylmuramoyl-tripeptide--D-alanyl-D-alanine ligase